MNNIKAKVIELYVIGVEVSKLADERVFAFAEPNLTIEDDGLGRVW